MTKSPRYLVIDGYIQEARKQLVTGGASTAADLYCSMLIKCSPPGAECDILFPSDAGASFPSDHELAGYNGIAWTGCSLCLNDSHMPEVAKQIDLARRAYRARVPSFGSCWAAQIAVVAAGGQVQPNPNGREMGIARKIQLTPAGRSHPRTFSMASRVTTTRSLTSRLAPWCSAVTHGHKCNRLPLPTKAAPFGDSNIIQNTTCMKWHD